MLFQTLAAPRLCDQGAHLAQAFRGHRRRHSGWSPFAAFPASTGRFFFSIAAIVAIDRKAVGMNQSFVARDGP